MRRTLVVPLIAASFLTAISARAGESDEPSRSLYLRYCSACHGAKGKGDGTVGSLMQTKPTDLTQIARKNDGQFPFGRVMQMIDGRNMVRAHGDPDMPVWGEIFKEQPTWDMGRRAEVLGKLMVITEYLRSIQEK